MHVRVPIVSVRIIIEVGRNAVVAARKSKTKSFSSGNQYGRRILSITTLGWNQSQSAYRKCGEEKSSHKFCLSLVSLFFVSRRLELLLNISSTRCVSALPSMRESDSAHRAVPRRRRKHAVYVRYRCNRTPFTTAIDGRHCWSDINRRILRGHPEGYSATLTA